MKIYVDNLPYHATDTDLRKHFEQYGRLTAATINRHQSGRHQGKSDGSGIVVMENREEGERAIKALDGQDMMGRSLKLSEAQSHTHDGQQAPPSEEMLSTEEEYDYFHNPYTFVPSPPRPLKDIKPGDFAGDFNPLEHPCGRKHNLDHAALKEDCWTGHIPIKLTTVTPLVLLENDGTEPDQKEHQTYDVLDFLPESSLRGMLRSAYEVVTNSRYACFSNDNRLAYRMRPQEALPLIPAIIESSTTGELVARLYTGTSTPTDRGPGDGSGGRGPMYAAMLTCYPKDSACINGYDPKTGDEVCAEIVSRRHNGPFYRFWQAVKVWPKSNPSPPTTGKVVTGRVLITNQNMKNKHDERIFFDPLETPLPVTDELKEGWCMRIQSYRDAHPDGDIFNRKDMYGESKKPWEVVKKSPTTTEYAWAPHLYHREGKVDRWDRKVQDALELKEGDMVYARCKFRSGEITEIEDLFPVLISRELYVDNPKDLLDLSLRPASKRNEMSPADRLFGWVPQEQGDDAGYKSRLRVVCEDGARPEIVQKFNGELPLTILGQPKPAQGRFYVADDQGDPQDDVRKQDAGYNASAGKSLRGRKQYWHHKGLEAELEESKQAECYWQPSVEDRTAIKRKGRYQEYRRPDDKDGKPQKDPQNRSITGWIKPGTEFKVSLYVQNLQPEEIGALLWLLTLPEKHYFKLGYGKPLGFGSVRLEIDNGVLPLGTSADWEKYYATFDANPPATLDGNQRNQCIQAFQASMEAAYNTYSSFDELPFIADFLQILEGPVDGSPIHYPRLDREPTPEGENFRWFTENERNWKEALPRVDESGLAYEPYDF